MNSKSNINSVDIDLSNKRMSHLGINPIAKMTRLRLKNKEIPLYTIGEAICFKLKVNSKKDIDNICIRLEIRSRDETSVGAALIHNFYDLKQGLENEFELSFLPEGLVPDKYLVLLVLYAVNDLGTYEDLDAVYPAFDFEIVDDNNTLKINWNKIHWGKIKFDDLVYIEENK